MPRGAVSGEMAGIPRGAVSGEIAGMPRGTTSDGSGIGAAAGGKSGNGGATGRPVVGGGTTGGSTKTGRSAGGDGGGGGGGRGVGGGTTGGSTKTGRSAGGDEGGDGSGGVGGAAGRAGGEFGETTLRAAAAGVTMPGPPGLFGEVSGGKDGGVTGNGCGWAALSDRRSTGAEGEAAEAAADASPHTAYELAGHPQDCSTCRNASAKAAAVAGRSSGALANAICKRSESSSGTCSSRSGVTGSRRMRRMTDAGASPSKAANGARPAISW
jgi:hypothetical protein